MLKRQLVLVAIDHATDVERTMAFALRTAKSREADVHAIQVLPHRAIDVDDRVDRSAFEPHNDGGVAIGARRASMPRSADRDGVRVQRVTLRGEAERVIPAYAQLYEASVLVVERDYGSSRFWRSGRVMNELARRSPMPLLVLPQRRTTERDESPPRRILTLVDFSIASAVALRTAVELARRHGARITLLHTLNNVTRHMTFSGGGAWEVIRRLPAQKEAATARLRRKAAFFGANDVDTEVATGLADGAMLEIARRSDADLIVMGSAHRSWLDRMLFGSTLRRVLRRATVPVLVVPVVAGAHAWPNEHLVHQLGGRAPTVSSAPSPVRAERLSLHEIPVGALV
jgi:nucleotide-binding universal stress UspA family protein